jgi:hypothetical protein
MSFTRFGNYKYTMKDSTRRGHASTARRVRLAKEQTPSNYCFDNNCLRRVMTVDGYVPCPKHGVEPGRCESCGDFTDDATDFCNGTRCAKDGE